MAKEFISNMFAELYSFDPNEEVDISKPVIDSKKENLNWLNSIKKLKSLWNRENEIKDHPATPNRLDEGLQTEFNDVDLDR